MTTSSGKLNFIKQAIIQTILTGIIVYGVQQYFEYKFAAKRLERENFINAKRDAYFEAIQIADKYMANTDYDSVDARTGKAIAAIYLHKHKTDLSSFEVEINTAYSKLMIFSADTNVLSSFYRIFVTPPTEKHVPIIEMKNFIKAVREDLGNSEKLPDEYEINYIVMPSKKDSI